VAAPDSIHEFRILSALLASVGEFALEAATRPFRSATGFDADRRRFRA
jgi:hypothetical protein